jgi:hypothetical protein
MTGELLRDGRYQIVGKLGEGAQGTTFDAIDRLKGQAVAIKRFSVRGARSWKDVELAEREARVLESLSHPALPAHIEHFEEGGALYLVMQKVEGRSLAVVTAGGGALSQADVVRFLNDLGGVLEYLHGRAPPVIHRDVNPKNVIRRPDGSYALVDFGAVRDRLKPEGGSTVVGTFGYMAPEQFQGRAVPASDVYSVGATALRLLTGVEPEKAPHKGLAIDVAGALGAGFDPALREVLESMLQPDPDRRASSIAPLLAKLRGAEASRPAEPPGTRTPSANDGNPSDSERPGRQAEWRREWDRSSYEPPDTRRGFRSSRAARRAERRARRHARRGSRGPLRGPPLVVLLLGIEVASMVVGIVVGVMLPMLLMLLSVVFGRALRDAARSARLAGQAARESMHELARVLQDGPDAPVVETDGREVDEAPAGQRARQRVVVPGEGNVVDTTGVEAGSESEPPREGRRAR